MRIINLDPIYKDMLITKLINIVMKNGKKSIAEKAVYEVCRLIKEKKNKSPLQVIKDAVENIKPSMELKKRKIGGSEHKVPFEINTKRQQSIAIKWIVQNANKNSEKSLALKLYTELMNAYNKKGSSYNMKVELHQLVEKNRANLHYRW